MDNQQEKKQFVPEDWIQAGFVRFKSINPNEAFMVQKQIRDKETGKPLYFITAGVHDYSGFGSKAPYPWGFSPTVQFLRDVTAHVTLSTHDPEVAEKEFHDIWVALGKPCCE